MLKTFAVFVVLASFAVSQDFGAIYDKSSIIVNFLSDEDVKAYQERKYFSQQTTI